MTGAQRGGWTTSAHEPTRVILLRHGQTPASVQRLYSGRGNPSLTDLGREQAAVAAHALAGQGIDVIVTSDLRRAADTATTVAAELGIADRVTFLPPQSREDLVQVYRASDVVAVPSHSESFGLVAIEAQACGTPVIAANVGGLGVAVDDGRTGVLVNGHRVGDWTNALEKLLAQPDRLVELGQHARAHAEQFSWEHTVDQLLESYGRAMRSFAAHQRPASPEVSATAAASARLRRRWRRRRNRVTV